MISETDAEKVQSDESAWSTMPPPAKHVLYRHSALLNFFS